MNVSTARRFLEIAVNQTRQALEMLEDLPSSQDLDDVINQHVRNLDTDSYYLLKWMRNED